MLYEELHAWGLKPSEAIELQKTLRRNEGRQKAFEEMMNDEL